MLNALRFLSAIFAAVGCLVVSLAPSQTCACCSIVCCSEVNANLNKLASVPEHSCCNSTTKSCCEHSVRSSNACQCASSKECCCKKRPPSPIGWEKHSPIRWELGLVAAFLDLPNVDSLGAIQQELKARDVDASDPPHRILHCVWRC